MSIVGAIERRAREGAIKVAIGAGTERKGYTERVVRAAGEFENVLIVGNAKKIREHSRDIEVVDSASVEKDLVGLLKKGLVDAVVRGTSRAHLFLEAIKEEFKPKKIARLAILETPLGKSFFFAPVGIDEGWNREDKLFLIEEGKRLARRLGIPLKIGVLSGGRKEDIGRHKVVDETLRDAEALAEHANVKDYSILIEDAIKDGANLIIAPNGIAGNLIFRTLVFLGGGKGYGAPILGIEKSCIDTSRANLKEGYARAIMAAKALG